MYKILVINGPSLNLLGIREPHLYGSESLIEINENLEKSFKDTCSLSFFQSNHEGDIVSSIHEAREGFSGLVINAAAYSHTSYAIADAISAISKPCVEVHLTNVYKREEFRQKSLIANLCLGQISGFGSYSYNLAIRALLNHLNH